MIIALLEVHGHTHAQETDLLLQHATYAYSGSSPYLFHEYRYFIEREDIEDLLSTYTNCRVKIDRFEDKRAYSLVLYPDKNI